ncbi:MAG: 50S ribosomal protein L4 [Sulfurimicrobium sp.]|jgi:large subunit ribosomal protein L4|nr:50S ribosomal protein L4 [Sulfurimicrobium sp.]MDP1704181.1 50S ribosomal protein L4 [Sulfurimicrobium sp.]MDP1898364.1 50S ribosomal protein L4 [Sulfurimicrobium sp.]MDP2198936.1 50S ribosomal protein L4 [Sulfurimicrobium sp.]MDP2961214.1 50S ribosomal protein L4 [Sulfurimicrobium sp.]
MELKLINDQGQATASVSASDVAFGREFNEDLVHQVVTAYMANARTATRAQKGRSEVAKSTRKPFRQKGTGNARAGMASSPLWRGGGKTFPNGPEENFSHKVNKKMHRAGMQSILSELARIGRLQVVEEFKIESPKTKKMVDKIKTLGFKSVLVVTDDLDENLYLSSRNLPHVLVIEAQHVDPVNLVRFPNVLLTRSAVKKFEEMLG